MRRQILLVALSLSTPLCVIADHSDEHAIEKANNVYAEAIVAADLDTLMTYYADDAVLMPPGMAPLTGKEAIRASWVELFSQFDILEAVSVLDEVIVLGNWAYGRGHYIGISADRSNDNQFEERLSFSGMWQKGEDGSWRIARDMYNGGAAP